MRARVLRSLCVTACAVILSTGPFALRAAAEEVDVEKVGVGYKVGNGIGFVGGDLVWRAVPHVTLDAQLAYGSSGGFTGYGVAPMVQFELKPVGHTPYLGIGFVYAALGNESTSGWATGFLANAGYEWRFASHLGVLVGAGIDDLGSVHARSGDLQATTSPAGIRFNLEAGVRWFF